MANRPQFATPKLVSRTYPVDKIPLVVRCDLAVAKLPDSNYTVDRSGYLLVWVSTVFDSLCGNRTVTYEYDRSQTTQDLVGCDIELVDPADCVGVALITWLRNLNLPASVVGFEIVDDAFAIILSNGEHIIANYQSAPRLTGMVIQNGVLRLEMSDNSTYTAQLPAGGGGGGGDPGPPGPAGNIVTVTQAGHSFLAGRVIRFDEGAGEYVLAQADTDAHAEAIGVVQSVDGDDFVYVPCGPIEGLANLVPGKTYFLSATQAGLMTATDPNAGNPALVSKPLLIATSTATAIVQIQRGFRTA